MWVWVYGQGLGEQVIIVYVSADSPLEIARHARATLGSPKLDESHLPPAPEEALERKPLARNGAELAFLSIGNGARLTYECLVPRSRFGSLGGTKANSSHPIELST